MPSLIKHTSRPIRSIRSVVGYISNRPCYWLNHGKCIKCFHCFLTFGSSRSDDVALSFSNFCKNPFTLNYAIYLSAVLFCNHAPNLVDRLAPRRKKYIRNRVLRSTSKQSINQSVSQAIKQSVSQ